MIQHLKSASRLLGPRQIDQPRDELQTSIDGSVHRGSLYLIGFMVFVLLWAVLGEIDEGVVFPGVVSPEGNRVTLQHASGGTVNELLVKEGDTVRAGQALIQLDDSKLKVALLSAEGQIKGLKGQISNLGRVVQLRRDQLRSLSEEDKLMRKLVSEGYFAPSKQRDLERNIMDLQQLLLQSEQNQSMLASQLAELTGRLFTIRSELDSTTVRSPLVGEVVLLHVGVAGSVVLPGGKMLDFLPNDRSLVVEGYIPSNLAKGITSGLPSVIRVTSVKSSGSPTISSRLIFVSADAIVQPNQAPAYLVRVKSDTPMFLENSKSEPLKPGTPVEVLVRTGRHTMFEYLTKSISDYLFRSMN